MRKDFARISSAAVIGIGLLVLYFAFLIRYSQVGDLSSLSEIETIILITLLLRAIILLVLGTKYVLQPIIPIIVFSIEALLIPPLLVMIILTGDQGFATLMGIILTAWFGASALILTPYTIYGFAKGLFKDGSLLGVMVIGSLELISVLFLAELLANVMSPIAGLSALGTLIISQIRADFNPTGLSSPGGDPLSYFGLIVFFVGMLCYFSLSSSILGEGVKLVYTLVIPLVGAILAFIWIVLSIQFIPNVLVVLTAPAAVIFVTVWMTARGKK